MDEDLVVLLINTSICCCFHKLLKNCQLRTMLLSPVRCKQVEV